MGAGVRVGGIFGIFGFLLLAFSRPSSPIPHLSGSLRSDDPLGAHDLSGERGLVLVSINRDG